MGKSFIHAGRNRDYIAYGRIAGHNIDKRFPNHSIYAGIREFSPQASENGNGKKKVSKPAVGVDDQNVVNALFSCNSDIHINTDSKKGQKPFFIINFKNCPELCQS
jgi:hypothetical protein